MTTNRERRRVANTNAMKPLRDWLIRETGYEVTKVVVNHTTALVWLRVEFEGGTVKVKIRKGQPSELLFDKAVKAIRGKSWL